MRPRATVGAGVRLWRATGSPGGAQSPANPYARDPKQPVDEAYTRRSRSTRPSRSSLSPLVDYLPASKTVPTPQAVLGDIAGAPGKLPYSKEVYDYMRLLEKASRA